MSKQQKKIPNDGDRYHERVLVSLMLRADPGWRDPHLCAEIPGAKKLDDIGIYYWRKREGGEEVENEENEHTEEEANRRGFIKEYVFYQIKWKNREGKEKMITEDQLLITSDSKYSLVKYFFSYEDLKREEFVKGATVGDVTLYTNVNFDTKNLKEKNIKIEKLPSTDYILHKKPFKKSNKKQDSAPENEEIKPARYRFGEGIIPKLQKLCSEYYTTRVARKLAECFFRHNAIKIDDDIFVHCHGVLAKEVIDVKTKKFRTEFIEGVKLSKDVKNFRDIFSSEIKKQKRNITLEELNDAVDRRVSVFKNDENEKIIVGLDLCPEFGKGSEDSWPTNAITEDQIKEFLDHLVFAVNQPNLDELDEIIMEEMREKMDDNTAQETYNKLKSKMEEVRRGKTRTEWIPFATFTTIRDEAISRCAIWFDVTSPVVSFTGRSEELEKLHEELESRGKAVISQAVAISGLGGIGKTELARKYIDSNKEYYDHNVIWINAENNETLSASFLRLARDKLEINSENAAGQRKDIKSIVAEVYKFFSKKKCIFIFDNADETDSIDVFLPKSTFPGAKKPYFLITSRSQKWKNMNLFPLIKLSINEAVVLIKKVLEQQTGDQESDIETLAEVLQYFPLALQQATAYINQKHEELRNIGSEFKVVNYLERYEKQPDILLDSPLSRHCNNNYENTTFKTVQITINDIKKQNQYQALKILNIISYFNSDDIPTKLFLKLGNSEEEIASSIEYLKQYSMVTLRENSERPTISIHRLVQQLIRIDLKKNGEEASILNDALKLFDNVKKHHHADMEHAACVWSYASEYKGLVKDFAALPFRIASHFFWTANYNSSASLAKKAGESLTETIGSDDIQTAKLFAFAAKSFITVGEIGDAWEVLGKVNQKYAVAFNVDLNKGLVLTLQGKHEDGLASLKTWAINFCCSDKPYDFYQWEDLRTLWGSSGYYGPLMKMLRKNLDEMKKSSDPFRARGATLVLIMCNILKIMRKYDDAFKIYTDFNKESRVRLPSQYDVDVVLRIRKSMADMMLHQRNYDGVRDIYKESTSEINLSRNDTITSQLLFVVAKAFEASGEDKEALKIALEATRRQEGSLDSDNRDVICTLFLVAKLYHKLGNNVLAIRNYDQVIQRSIGNVTGLITQHDISYTVLCVIQILRKPETLKETLNDLKNFSEVTNKTLGPGDRFSLLLKNCIDRWERHGDAGVDICREFSEFTIFTEDGIDKRERGSPKMYFQPLLHHAVSCNKLDTVKYFVNAGHNVNGKDFEGDTPLHIAALKGYGKVTEYLLSENCEVDQKNNDGYTALSIAVMKGHLEVVEILLNKGANSEVRVLMENGNHIPLLHCAVLLNHLDVVKCLKNRGHNVNDKDSEGHTPLHVAALKGYGKVTEWLLSENCEVDQKDNDGYTALSLAVMKGHLEVVEILLNKGANSEVRISMDGTHMPLLNFAVLHI